jgi:1-acyl-sn-glycerol-3-phosphate acyltransferase
MANNGPVGLRTFKGSPDDFCDAALADFPRVANVVHDVATRAVWLWSKLYWHWTCEGPSPFAGPDPRGRGRVVVANHASMLDPTLLMTVARVSGSTLRPLYKSELNGAGAVSWFFSRVGAIPIRRGSADTKALKRAVKALARGENVLVFPEGTRVWDPDARPELHGGFAMIALMANAEVVPVAIDGTELINPYKGRLLPRPARVRVRYGEPLRADGLVDASLPRREKADALERAAMERVYAMRSELRAAAGKA